jgi:hypothetical protein
MGYLLVSSPHHSTYLPAAPVSPHTEEKTQKMRSATRAHGALHL